MSGQWFYEAKSKRHRDKIHGADIIRASMRRKPAAVGKHLAYVLLWKGWHGDDSLTQLTSNAAVCEIQEECISVMNRKWFKWGILYVILQC